LKGPSPRRLWEYCRKRLALAAYLDAPGDGRSSPRISASALLWSLLFCKFVRVFSHAGVESLVRLTGRPMGIRRPFSDDALAYFTERLSVPELRRALVRLLRHIKRNKAFEASPRIGVALDGTGAGRTERSRCELCRPQGGGYGHRFSAISVVGTGLELPFDIEPYGPGDSELAASTRVLGRAITALGPRFADFVVGDALYANAPFLNYAGDLGLRAIASLKENLPDLYAAVRKRFADEPAHGVFQHGRDRIEYWDAEDFEPWGELRWANVRVLRYRQHRPDGKVFDASWLTDFSVRSVGPRALFLLCKSRWAIENQGFNDAKNRYGLEHVPHHHPNSIVIHALLTLLALCIQRLYRLRNLRRGTHQPPSAIDFVRMLLITLATAPCFDTG
jgi:hypothetical protein